MSRKALFDFARPLAPGGQLTAAMVSAGDAFADALGLPREGQNAGGTLAPPAVVKAAPAAQADITARIALELVGHEAIVREAYKDSVGVWTWGVGVTSASGHAVERYKDNPQSIERCLEVYAWLLREKYAPAVRKAFEGCALTEAQFGAALSFHYNTGAIGRADWVTSWKAGRTADARAQFMNWRKPPEILERRGKERDLFFDGTWSGDGTALVLPVRKPSYAPDFRNGRRVDIRAEMAAALGAG